MRTLCAVLLLASTRARAEAPRLWSAEQRLESKAGPLVWKVTYGETETVIEAHHPQWSVVHRCAPDGAPRETLKTVGKRVTRLVWKPDGVEFTFDVAAKTPMRKISEKNLWDGDTLDARLAAVPWKKGKTLEFRIVDTDKDGGDVVPMKAELDGDERCARGPCHHVVMHYTGLGALFVAPWHYRYGIEAGAPYLQYAHEGETFSAK